MPDIKEVYAVATKILKTHYLCDNCLGRLFSKKLNLSSNPRLGKKLNPHDQSSKKCYICKNLFDKLDSYLKLMLESCSSYGFSSFVVGAKIKPSIIDRDDYIRSKFQLRGIDSIKTDLTHELSKRFSRKTKKKFNFLDPDLTFTLDFKEGTCHVRTKQISLQGRYRKTKRGFSQKQKSCENCSGKGCMKCDYHGLNDYDSVEGQISKFLFKKFGGTIAKFTWIGGEDKSSLVLGSGRPFFVRIQNPLKRKTRLPKTFETNSVIIDNCKLVPTIPKNPLEFKSEIEIKITTENEIQSSLLKKLKYELKNPIEIYEQNGRRSEKKIFNSKYKKNSKNNFTLTVDVEGGFPVKRFVIGDNVVPGVSQILSDNCKCENFDFLKIQMITNN